MRKPVFEVFDQVRIKPTYAATEASYRLEILDIKTRDIINNKGADQTVQMRGPICAFVVCIWHKHVFSWHGSILNMLGANFRYFGQFSGFLKKNVGSRSK